MEDKLKLLLFYVSFTSAFYTEEFPVKLLEVESLADRYPAAESEYRLSVTNGFVSFKCFLISYNVDGRMRMQTQQKQKYSMGFQTKDSSSTQGAVLSTYYHLSWSKDLP